TAAGVAHHAGRLAPRQSAVFFEPALDTAAGDELHDEVIHVLVLVDLVNGDDMRMIETSDGAGLAQEALDNGGMSGIVRRQHLDRDGSAQERIEGFVDDAIAALPEFRHETILAEIGEKGTGPRAQTGVLRRVVLA